MSGDKLGSTRTRWTSGSTRAGRRCLVVGSVRRPRRAMYTRDAGRLEPHGAEGSSKHAPYIAIRRLRRVPRLLPKYSRTTQTYSIRYRVHVGSIRNLLARNAGAVVTLRDIRRQRRRKVVRRGSQRLCSQAPSVSTRCLTTGGRAA